MFLRKLSAFKLLSRGENAVSVQQSQRVQHIRKVFPFRTGYDFSKINCVKSYQTEPPKSVDFGGFVTFEK